MFGYGYQACLLRIGEDGPTRANSTAAQSLLPGGRALTLPNNAFTSRSDEILVEAGGRISTLGSSPGTLALNLLLGSSVVFGGGNMTLNVSGKTNVSWLYQARLSCRDIGDTATLLGMGFWMSEAVIGAPLPSAGGAPAHMLPYGAAPAVGATFDSDGALLVDFQEQWSTASANNSITLHHFAVYAPIGG